MILSKYYYPPVNFYSVWFSEMVLRCLEKNNYKITKNDVVLDIGCGLGNHCFGLLNSCSPKEIYGFDISKETINLLGTFTDKIKFQSVDICKDDISGLKNKFTAIFSCDVYEHVENPQLMLDNIYSILAEGGVVSITFPNMDNHGHNQLKSVKEFTGKLDKAGFRKYNVVIVENLSLLYRIYCRFYVLLQDLSDKIYGIKRNPGRIPETDEFHEMYAYTKINKLKDKKFLVVSINIFYELMKKIGRLSSIYVSNTSNEDVKNKRIVFFACK